MEAHKGPFHFYNGTSNMPYFLLKFCCYSLDNIKVNYEVMLEFLVELEHLGNRH